MVSSASTQARWCGAMGSGSVLWTHVTRLYLFCGLPWLIFLSSSRSAAVILFLRMITPEICPLRLLDSPQTRRNQLFSDHVEPLLNRWVCWSGRVWFLFFANLGMAKYLEKHIETYVFLFVATRGVFGVIFVQCEIGVWDETYRKPMVWATKRLGGQLGPSTLGAKFP